jgi:hypothetical protein
VLHMLDLALCEIHSYNRELRAIFICPCNEKQIVLRTIHKDSVRKNEIIDLLG